MWAIFTIGVTILELRGTVVGSHSTTKVKSLLCNFLTMPTNLSTDIGVPLWSVNLKFSEDPSDISMLNVFITKKNVKTPCAVLKTEYHIYLHSFLKLSNDKSSQFKEIILKSHPILVRTMNGISFSPLIFESINLVHRIWVRKSVCSLTFNQ